MHPGKFDRGLIGRDRNTKIAERIKRIECVGWNTGFRVGGRVERLCARRNRRMRRNGQYGLTKRLEGAAGWRGQFVMRFHVLVISVRVEHHLVSEDFVISSEITAVALAFRIGE